METTNERPLILISNDDGYQAKGINELIKMVAPLGVILVDYPGFNLSIAKYVHRGYGSTRIVQMLKVINAANRRNNR